MSRLPIRRDLFAPLLIATGFLIVYLLLPVKVSSTDGFTFAYQIKEGVELFSPHHLFYNIQGYLWVGLTGWLGNFDVLASLKVFNAITAVICLLLLNLLMDYRGVTLQKRIIWLLLVGSSWGVMRFATENETYLAPLVYALLGSLFFSRYTSTGKDKFLVMAGASTAFAALVHQIHFFWWLSLLLALLAHRKPVRAIFSYALPALMVPLAYVLVLVYYNQTDLTIQSLTEFVFHDYYSGYASIEPEGISFLMTPISFIRTFIQIHGYLRYLPAFGSIYLIGASASLIALMGSLFWIRKIRFNKGVFKDLFVGAHILAFVLHLAFAFVSHGNAEFMIMLPFLAAILLSLFVYNEIRLVGFMAVGLFVWNFFLGLLPLHLHDLDDSRMASKHLLNAIETNHPEKTFFVLYYRPGTTGAVRYATGVEAENTLSGVKTPVQGTLNEVVDQHLKDGVQVYTNCINRPQTLSRATLVIENNTDIYAKYKQEKIDSLTSLTGTYYLYQLLPKGQ
jgi:hypothetical protein